MAKSKKVMLTVVSVLSLFAVSIAQAAYGLTKSSSANVVAPNCGIDGGNGRK